MLQITWQMQIKCKAQKYVIAFGIMGSFSSFVEFSDVGVAVWILYDGYNSNISNILKVA